MHFKKSLFLAVIGISTLSSITFPAGLPISADSAELKEAGLQVGDVYQETIEGADCPNFSQITHIDRWGYVYYTETVGIPFGTIGTKKIDHSTGPSKNDYKGYHYRATMLRAFIYYLDDNDGLQKKNIILVEDPEIIQQYNDLAAIAAIRLKYKEPFEKNRFLRDMLGRPIRLLEPKKFKPIRCVNGGLSRYATGEMDPHFISFDYQYDYIIAHKNNSYMRTYRENEGVRSLDKLPRDDVGEIDPAFLSFCYEHRDTIELFGWSLEEEEQRELEGKLNSIMSRPLIFAWEELRKQKIRNNSSLGSLPIEIVALIAGKDPSSAKTQNGKEEEGSDFPNGDPSAAAAAAAVPRSRYRSCPEALEENSGGDSSGAAAAVFHFQDLKRQRR